MKTFQIFIILTSLFFVNLAANSVANITGLRGEANINRDGQILLAALGSDLHEKDIVTTKENTKVQIIFKDETIITIGKNSKFAIDEYLFEDKREPVAKFAMLKGAMRTITGHIGDVAPQKFSVATKTATIGIRGTNFSVFVQEDGTTQAVCTFGAVSVNINGVSHLVQQGFMLSISPTGAVEIKPFTPKELNKMKKDSFTATSKKTDDTKDPETVVVDSPQLDNTRIEITPVVLEDIGENTQKATEEENIQEDTETVEKIAAEKKAAEEEAARKAAADAAAAAATTTTTTTSTAISLSDIIAGYTMNNAQYTGTYTSSNPEIFKAGNAQLDIDFGADTVDLKLTPTDATDYVQFNQSPTFTGTQFNVSGNTQGTGGIRSIVSGSATGTFGGTTGNSVTGTYTFNPAAPDDISGTYSVTSSQTLQ